MPAAKEDLLVVFILLAVLIAAILLHLDYKIDRLHRLLEAKKEPKE